MRWLAGLVFSVFALAACTAASAHDQGPPVGAALPALEAQDQSDTTQNFDSLKGENGLVLAFVRSSDWCSYCQRQLIGLEGVRGEIEARGWRLAAVTTDIVSKNARFAARREIGFPLLSDADYALTQRFELTDPAISGRHAGVPVPTILFVASDGQVAARLGDANFRVRPAPEVVLETIDNLN